jgi:hypothetical protein
MSSWREAQQQHASRGVTETRDRTAPVLLIGERRATLAGYLLAPGDQSWAAPAATDLCRKLS